MSDEEDEMRAIHSPSGHHRDGPGREELVHLARNDVTGDRPERQCRGERIRPRMAAGPCDREFLA